MRITLLFTTFLITQFGFLILGLIALEVAAVVMTNKDRAVRK